MSKVSLAGTSQALPPSKSRPRLRPWVEQRHHGDDHDDDRGDEPDLAAAVEVDRRLAVEQPPEAGLGDLFVRVHDVTGLIPKADRLRMYALDASSNMNGLVNVYRTSRSQNVVTPR